MKVHLMAADADVNPTAVGDLADPVAALAQDLQIDVLLDAMGSGDRLQRAAARSALLSPLTSPEAVTYRQEVLADCLAHPHVPRALYDIATRALEAERSVWWSPRFRPEMVLDRAVRVLTAQLEIIEELRALVAQHGDTLASPGMRAFVRTVRAELDDAGMAQLRDQLAVLARRDTLLFAAELAPDGQVEHPLPRTPMSAGRVFRRVALAKPRFSFTVPDRDEAGFKALEELRDRALWRVADAADQAAGHVHAFLDALRGEVAFYLGCLALHERLTTVGMPVCFPQPLPVGDDDVRIEGVYDPALVLTTGQPAVTNDVHADAMRLVVVTGANHGGKTTLLRAIGLAHLMLGAGMFVPATAMRAALVPTVRSHWAREEDADLQHGKLDEELSRLSRLVDDLDPGALLLSNESLSSTDEAEGSRIALTLLRALTRAGVRVVAVTHLFDLAGRLYESGDPPALFLRAARGDNGQRPYRIEPGSPLATSFARDLYEQEFGPAAEGVTSVGGNRDRLEGSHE